MVDEGMREKEKTEGGKEKEGWSERMTEGENASLFGPF